MISQDELGGSRLAEPRAALRAPNPWWALARGDYRVSPLWPEAGEEELRVAGGRGSSRRGRPRRQAPGPNVVLVVRAAHPGGPPPPVPAVLGVPPPLTRRLPTGPLPGTHPRIGKEQIVAERAPFPSLPPGSGHRRASAPRVSPPPGRIDSVERLGSENQKGKDYELRRRGTGTRGREIIGHGHRWPGGK